MADPVCREFVEQEGMLCMIVGEDRRVVVYPCVENKLMNFLMVRANVSVLRASANWFCYRSTQVASLAQTTLAGTKKVIRSVCSKVALAWLHRFVLF